MLFCKPVKMPPILGKRHGFSLNPLQILDLQGVFLWINLWRMWITQIYITWFLSIIFCLCQPVFRHTNEIEHVGAIHESPDTAGAKSADDLWSPLRRKSPPLCLCMPATYDTKNAHFVILPTLLSYFSNFYPHFALFRQFQKFHTFYRKILWTFYFLYVKMYVVEIGFYHKYRQIIIS